MTTSRGEGLRRRLARTSVRSRTTGAAVAVLAIVLLVGAVAVVLSLRAVLTEGVASSAEQRLAEVASGIETDGLPTPPADTGSDPGSDSDSDSGADDDLRDRLEDAADDDVLLVVDAGGSVLTSLGEEEEARELARRIADEGSDLDDRVTLDDEAYVLVSEDVEVAGSGTDDVTVLLARPLESVSESVTTLTLLFTASLPVALGLIGLTTWLVVGRALRPVERIRAEAASIDGARLDRRVPEPDSGDEISRLARTMNLMLDRLESSARRQRQLVSDTSHELRSPIATIRQTAEISEAHPDALPPGELGSIALAESIRMQGIVDDLLLLAKADEHDLGLTSREVDLDDLVLAEIRRLRSLPVQVETRIEAARTNGDGRALARVLRNLVDNAVRHADTVLRLELVPEENRAVLAVEDDGPGIPASDRQRVFERFVRLDDARARDEGGSGLGLAIVQEIVAAHGGSVRVVDGMLGGARIEVRLPLHT